ncbi:hypothetical protein JCM10207_003051 [Rhodosporidiobolus poonsookiae]
MADFLYRAGPPPPRAPYGGRPANDQPPPPGLRYLPPSQARGPPSPNPYADPRGAAPSNSAYPYPQQNYAPNPPFASPSSPHRSPDLGAIKCSSCGEAVSLEQLGDHVCRPAERGLDEKGRNLNELRVDVRAAAPPTGFQRAGLPMRSPMYPGHLEATPPHTPGSAGSNPPRSVSPSADQLSRSVGSNASSASSSRLPFFERYQKQYGPGVGQQNGSGLAGVGAGGMTRSGTMETFSPPSKHGGSPSPRLASPGFSPTPSFQSSGFPFPSSNSAPNLNHPPSQRQDSLPQTRSYRQLPSQAQQDPMRGHTPPAGLAQLRAQAGNSSPQDASRSRKVSLKERGMSPHPPAPSAPHRATPSQSSSASSNYLPYDRRDSASLKASQSTPADLSSYARATPPPPRKDSTSSNLDACLEDLRILTDENDRDSGAQALIDDFIAGRRGSYGLDSSDGGDPLATPKAATSSAARSKTGLPSSRSTPALAAGLAAPAPTPSSLPSSGSVPNLSSSSSTSSSASASSSRRPSQSCTTCRRALTSPSETQLSGDGQPFCRPCFAERFLPKCRKCRLPIEGGAVTSSDGKVVGKYHRACFGCFECGEKFAGGEFYVFDGKPYCQQHYHFLNGSLCVNCTKPIEGPCVSLVGEENGGGGRYHPPCFNCSNASCAVPLLEHHFVVAGFPYCEAHSAGPVRRRPQKAGEGDKERAKKRMTIITRR